MVWLPSLRFLMWIHLQINGVSSVNRGPSTDHPTTYTINQRWPSSSTHMCRTGLKVINVVSLSGTRSVTDLSHDGSLCALIGIRLWNKHRNLWTEWCVSWMTLIVVLKFNVESCIYFVLWMHFNSLESALSKMYTTQRLDLLLRYIDNYDVFNLSQWFQLYSQCFLCEQYDVRHWWWCTPSQSIIMFFGVRCSGVKRN